MNHLTKIFDTSDNTDVAAGRCAADVTSATTLETALDALPATLPTTLVASLTTLDATLDTFDPMLDTPDAISDVRDASTDVTPLTSDDTADGSADVRFPTSDRLTLLAMLSISDRLSERLYVVGTCGCVSCNHGISYPPTPICTESAAVISSSPSGMIGSDARAPFVSRTFPNVPLFALPWAGMTKLSNA